MKIEQLASSLYDSQIRVIRCSRNDYDARSRSHDKARLTGEYCEAWNLDKHKHDYYELLYFLDGSANVEIDSQRIPLSLYYMIIYPKGIYHKECLLPNRHCEVICLGVDIKNFDLGETIHLIDRDSKFLWLFENILEEKLSETPNQFLMEYYVKSVFLLALNKYGNNAVPYISNIDFVLHYLSNHFNEVIDLKEIASMACVSESYLSRCFKKKTNTTLVKYVNQLRIEAAKKMLRTSDLSIEQIGYKTGFNSPKYFSKIFRTYCSETPSDYRRVPEK